MREKFLKLLSKYQVTSASAEDFWNEIEQNYTKASRHYHSLTHLSDLYQQLLPIKDIVENWDVLLFSLFYHDIIYKATKTDNELKSAAFAEKRMTKIGLDKQMIKLCVNQIIATKSHAVNDEMDTNYFTDADLSILGRDKMRYDKYCQEIRKEYSIYPTFMYKKGRKKVVEHFLAMTRVYKTKYFFAKYEQQARLNLGCELRSLS